MSEKVTTTENDGRFQVTRSDDGIVVRHASTGAERRVASEDKVIAAKAELREQEMTGGEGRGHQIIKRGRA